METPQQAPAQQAPAPAQQAPAPQQQSQSTERSSGNSALGSPSDIKSRLDAFMSGDKGSQKESASKEKSAPKKEAQSILPIEKAAQAQKGAEKTDDKTVDPTKGTDGMTPEQRRAFLENKKNAEESSKRISELEKLVADREATVKERDELKQRLEQREKEMEAVEVQVALERLKKSAEYQETILQPMKKLVGELDKISRASEISLDSMLDAIENPNEVEGNAAISEMMERLDTLTVRKLERMINDIRELNSQADRLHSNPSESLKAAEFKEKERKQAESKKQAEIYSKSFDAVVDRFREVDPNLLQENGELTEDAKQAFDEARKVDWDSTPPDIKAYFAQAGHLLIVKNREIERLRDERDKLQDSVARLSRKPSPSKGSVPQASQERETIPANQKPGDRFAAWRDNQ